jgi:hypothetical protein
MDKNAKKANPKNEICLYDIRKHNLTAFRQGKDILQISKVWRTLRLPVIRSTAEIAPKRTAGSFIPLNTHCVVTVLAFLELKQKLTFFKGII